MPRYFFHRTDGDRDIDHEGVELPSIEDARHEAVAFASDTLRSDKYKLWDGGEVRVEAADATGKVLFVVILTTEVRAT